jgi:7,8-dihydropterin-6-yl-methyl-4-(beta-D-ribofuranosyl)aminobenzene 5'-phosphate synthase
MKIGILGSGDVGRRLGDGFIELGHYAKKITGIRKIYAIIGIYEEVIEPTLKELQNIDPAYVVPCHCTGWKATNKIIDLMPEKFIQSSVGTVFTF